MLLMVGAGRAGQGAALVVVVVSLRSEAGGQVHGGVHADRERREGRERGGRERETVRRDADWRRRAGWGGENARGRWLASSTWRYRMLSALCAMHHATRTMHLEQQHQQQHHAPRRTRGSRRPWAQRACVRAGAGEQRRPLLACWQRPTQAVACGAVAGRPRPWPWLSGDATQRNPRRRRAASPRSLAGRPLAASGVPPGHGTHDAW